MDRLEQSCMTLMSQATGQQQQPGQRQHRDDCAGDHACQGDQDSSGETVKKIHEIIIRIY